MRGKTEPVGTSQNYQRFAWGTLALAAVVALAGTDHGEDPVASPLTVTAVADAAVVAPKMARPAFAVTNPPAADDLEQADGEVASADDETADAGVTGAEASPAAPGSAPPMAGPANAAQAGQLVSSSRTRSGGIAQGDDLTSRRAN